MVVHDVLEERRGDGRIHGITTFTEDLERRLRDDVELRAHHHLVAYRFGFRALIEQRISGIGGSRLNLAHRCGHHAREDERQD